MKLYIRSSEEIDEHDVLFEDYIIIDVDDSDIKAICASEDLVRFPGPDIFREDVAKILLNEYNFDIIKEPDGKLGYVSNKNGSESVYFNVYYDLSNADPILKRIGTSAKAPRSGKVLCFIHFRFSGHILENVGDVDHNNFLNDNLNKHTQRHPEINFKVREEPVIVPERTLLLQYDKVKEFVEDELDVRIFGWVRKALKQHPELF